MRKILFLTFLISLLFVTRTSPRQSAHNEFYFWSTQTGQWWTKVSGDYCFHYGMGGKIKSITHILQQCHDRKNRLVLHKWKWQDLRLVQKFSAAVRDICVLKLPDQKAPEAMLAIFDRTPFCMKAEEIDPDIDKKIPILTAQEWGQKFDSKKINYWR